MLSTKWSYGAILVAILAFFADPQACVSPVKLIGWIPGFDAHAASAVAALIATLIGVYAKSPDLPVKKKRGK